MQSGVLLCDIGNSALKIGIALGADIVAAYSLSAGSDVTADSLGLNLLALIQHAGLRSADFAACAAVSVVPAMNAVLTRAVARYLDCPTFFAPDRLPVPLANNYSQPAEVGADRLVGAYAATLAVPDSPSLIVVDFGTAVTFDCVSNHAYRGGLIFPGPATAAAALSSRTAKLPTVSLEAAECELQPGLDTATSIRHGLLFGYVCITEGLCGRLRRQMQEPVRVIATGGFAQALSRFTQVFDLVLPNLLLEGLLSLYIQSCQTYGQPYK